MSDGFPDRLTQLRTRWQGDPSSRIFLQLAEEYRHLGRVQDALEVLDSGLKEHPGYLSALVAKGRCLLELGDAEKARGVLERVVQQDATQMVANKLLVRAYLETSEPERAGQRLDLYSLLNDSDPEIEELRRRVVAMSRPPRQADGPRPEEPAERSRMDPTETPAAEVFDLGPAAPPRAAAAEDDLFDLGVLPETLPLAPSIPSIGSSASAPSSPSTSSIPSAPSTASASNSPSAPSTASAPGTIGAAGAAIPPFPRGRSEGNGAEPFPDPAPEESRRLYLAGFTTGRIFYFEDLAAALEKATATPAAAVPTAARAAEEPAAAVVAALGEPAAAGEPAVAGEHPAAAAEHPATAGEPAAAATHDVAPLPRSLPAPAMAAAATVTLAELYMRQGHLEEAERIFTEVLHREPGNTAAREGMSRLAFLAPAAAAPSPASPAPVPPAPAVPAPVAPVLTSAPAPPSELAPTSEVAPASEVAPTSEMAPASAPAPTSPSAPTSEPTLASEPIPVSAAAPAAMPVSAAAPAPASEPVEAAPRAPAPVPAALSAGVLSAQLLAGLQDPHAPRKVRRAYLLQSYLARLRQPRSPHVP